MNNNFPVDKTETYTGLSLQYKVKVIVRLRLRFIKFKHFTCYLDAVNM